MRAADNECDDNILYHLLCCYFYQYDSYYPVVVVDGKWWIESSDSRK